MNGGIRFINGEVRILEVMKSKFIIFATMVHLEKSEEWFESWFDSPYYHVLYDHRNDDEAREFIESLTKFIELESGATVLDLCCGAGRHSRVIHALGFDTTGCDLSANSIATAKEFEQDGLRFFRHDMRDPLPAQYDAIFNLFTSFGYFETLEDNARVLNSVIDALNPNGIFVLDFMHAEGVIRNLTPQETIEKRCPDGRCVEFHITREVIDGRIVKTIAFEADGRKHVYQEKVQALTKSDFERLFAASGLTVKNWIGNYRCEPFESESADRLIAICTK